MKTIHLLAITVSLLSVTSCSVHYRITSRIATDGSVYREVYAKGDAESDTASPFLFRTDDGWRIVRLDSAVTFNVRGNARRFSVKASRHYPSIGGECFSVTPENEYARPLAVPHERLEKRFRWLYTYYTYTATYKGFPDKGPVPLGDYLSAEEQALWFRGEGLSSKGENGFELNERLNDIDRRFTEWCRRSGYEIYCEIIRQSADDSTYAGLVDPCKEAVYKRFKEEDKWEMTDLESICKALDERHHTDYYSLLYEEKGEAMRAAFEERLRFTDLLGHVIRFEVAMPGKPLSSNAQSVEGDTLIWEVDGFRLLGGDCSLTATTRKANYWAFAISLLAVLAVFAICAGRLSKR